MAYNDVIAIETPLKSGFVGALPGHLMLKLLKSSRAKGLFLTVKDTEVLIGAGKAVFKFPRLLEDAFVFKMPARGKIALDVDKYLGAIEHCLRSVSSDTANPERVGVTCVFSDDGVSMYATDDNTLSYAFVAGETPPELDRVVISAPFCRELIKLAKGKTGTKLFFSKDYVIGQVGGTTLFAQLIGLGNAKPMNYEDIVKRHVPKGPMPTIPDRFPGAIERACAVADSHLEQQHTAIVVDDENINFLTTSDVGEHKENMPVPEGQTEKADIRVEPKYLKDVGAFEYMLIQKGSIVFTTKKRDCVYLVSAMNQKR